MAYASLEGYDLVLVVAGDVIHLRDPVDRVIQNLVAGGGLRVDGILVGGVALERGTADDGVDVVRGIFAKAEDGITALGGQGGAVHGESIANIGGRDG